MRIRPYEASDASHLSALYRRSVETIGPRDYSAAQVAAWASRCPSPERIGALANDGRCMLVAVDATDAPLAFGDLEPDGHIHFLYCAPEVAGTGAASALYEALESRARELGIDRLYAEASEAARRFFLRKGFTVVRRRDFDIDGVPIHNYAVEKRLSGAIAARD
jgi:putative acetyltransferase